MMSRPGPEKPSSSTKDSGNATALQRLLADQRIWLATQTAPYSLAPHALSSTYPHLDQLLHHGGWPCGLTELMSDTAGCGEISLLLPALATLSQQGCVMLIAPPFSICAPAWRQAGIELSRLFVIRSTTLPDQLWAIEQSLQSAACKAVLSWEMPDCGQLAFRALQKFQLLAREKQNRVYLFRPCKRLLQASPAGLRMAIRSSGQDLHIEILKQPGGWGGQQLSVQVRGFQEESMLSASEWPCHHPSAAFDTSRDGTRTLVDAEAASGHQDSLQTKHRVSAKLKLQ